LSLNLCTEREGFLDVRYSYLCPAILIINMSTDDLREDIMTDVLLSQLAIFSQSQTFEVNGYNALNVEILKHRAG
jgi:hypothetical protein